MKKRIFSVLRLLMICLVSGMLPFWQADAADIITETTSGNSGSYHILIAVAGILLAASIFCIVVIRRKRRREKALIEATRSLIRSNLLVADDFLSGSAAEPQQEEPERKGSGLRTMTDILFYIVIFGIVFMAFVSTANGPRNIFGYSYFTVLTRSMQDEIPKGSLVITKKTDPDELEVGDTITFFKNATTTVTHKIADIYEDYNSSGARGFQTKGVNNSNPDTDIVLAVNVVGKVVFSMPKAGAILAALRDNLVLAFLALALLMVLSFSLQVYFRIRKEEKQEKQEKQ